MPQHVTHVTVENLHAQQMIGALYRQMWDFKATGTGAHLLINLSRDTSPQVYRDIRVEPEQFRIHEEGLWVDCPGFAGLMLWLRITALSGMLYYHLPPEETDAPQEESLVETA